MSNIAGSTPTPNVAGPSTPTAQLGLPSAAAPGPSFTPSGFTFGNIMDAFNLAKASSGIVQLLPDFYDISSAGQGLPMASGVVYQGSGWTLTYSGIPDLSPAMGSGTWIVGNGAFDAFDGNAVDGTAPFGSSAAFSQAGLTNCGILGLGVSNFAKGCKIGSNYNPGAFYSKFDGLVALNCGWGLWFENMLHVEYGRLYAFNNTLGQVRFRSSSTSAVLQPSNCNAREIVGSVPAASYLARGIVISCAHGTNGGLSAASILQSNRFGQSTSSQSATTNGTATVAVSNTANYMVGMPVAFTSLGGATGLVANQIYFITAIVANTSITIANAPFGSNLTPGAGTPTIVTQGMPCIEMVADDSTANNNPTLYFAGLLDMEAGGTCKFIGQNLAIGCALTTSAQPGISTQDFCFRNSNVPIYLQALAAAPNIDTSDGSSQQVQLLGFPPGPNSIGPTFGLRGNAAQKSLNISLVNGGLDTWKGNTVGGWDLVETQVPVCDYAGAQFSTSQNLTTQFSGLVEFNGGSGQTFTLPTVTSAMSGLPFKIVNRGSSALTVSTAAGQGFNDTTRTSVTVNAGASISVAAQVLSGTLYWQVTGIGGTYSAGTISTM